MIGKMAALFISHFFKIAGLKSGDVDSSINTGFNTFRRSVRKSVFGIFIDWNHLLIKASKTQF
jgi:hypothetical protein